MKSILLKPYKEVTTEAVLLDLEADAKKHVGLWVDMNNNQERKYVKDKAALGKSLLKKLDRSRIDQKTAHGVMLDTEADTLALRIKDIISPYTILIDLHADEQKEIRDKTKAREEAKNTAFEKERDHDYALLMNDRAMLEKKEAEEAKFIYESNLKKEAAAKAVLEASEKIAQAKRCEAAEDARRLANTKHVRSVNAEALDSLCLIEGVSIELGKEIVKAIARNQIKNISIKY